VDGALDLGRQEQLHAHLVHCSPCRTEVAELRRLRSRLRAPAPLTAPEELARRLVAIAGPEAAAPLWTRPFRRTPAGSLTSPRRALRVRRALAVVVAGASVVGAATAGYLAAPTSTLAAVPDPAAEAQAEFTSSLAQLPLATDALGAVLSARPTDLAAPVPVSAGFAATTGTRRLSPSQAHATMARAARAVGAVSYRGLQTYRADVAGDSRSATVEVVAVSGQGTRTRVLNSGQRAVSARVGPAVSASRVVDERLLALLEHNYAVTAWAGAQAAGRRAVLVEASRDARPAARWWVDDASGIVLARQTFDRSGALVLQVGFSTVQVSRSGPVKERLPEQLVVPPTTTVLGLAARSGLSQQGWVCPDELAGLSLVRLSSDDPVTPAALHLVYSDGLATVSVFEQRGELRSPPAGSSYDDRLRAFTRDGASSLASWQSNDTVVTVVTDGSSERLAAAVTSLPHEAPPERTTMERIRAGWASILADMKG
jgi:negative regulator of sigma E activity